MKKDTKTRPQKTRKYTIRLDQFRAEKPDCSNQRDAFRVIAGVIYFFSQTNKATCRNEIRVIDISLKLYPYFFYTNSDLRRDTPCDLSQKQGATYSVIYNTYLQATQPIKDYWLNLLLDIEAKS